VDLSHSTLKEQQRLNYELVADLTAYIRSIQPPGVQVSVAGRLERWERKTVRSRSSGLLWTVCARSWPKRTGPEGHFQDQHSDRDHPRRSSSSRWKVAQVSLDFDTLERLSRVAREEYELAGAVQHGASTLPPRSFISFPARAAEIHLATEFQNMIYEDPAFPADLRQEIYEHLEKDPSSEHKEGETKEQFIYKNRKRAFGPFKAKLWGLRERSGPRSAPGWRRNSPSSSRN